MKAVRFFLMTIAAFWLPGTSAAAQASPNPQQATSQSVEKSDELQNDVRKARNQGHPNEADENQGQSADVTRMMTKHRPSTNRSTATPSRQLHLAKTSIAGSLRTNAPQSFSLSQQAVPKAVTNVQNKSVSHHRASVPSAAVCVDGQQIRNLRDPGARLASSGGPLTTARRTAVINGTNMKRKP